MFTLYYTGNKTCDKDNYVYIYTYRDNVSFATTPATFKTTKPTTVKLVPDLPDTKEAEEEHQTSLTIFFILLVIG